MKESYLQTTNINSEQLAKYIIEAKGPERTMLKFSEDTGLDNTKLSKIARGKIKVPLSKDTLKKIYACRSETAQFTFEDLMKANGAAFYVLPNASSDEIAHQRENIQRVKSICRNTIMHSLVSRGFAVSAMPHDYNNVRYEAPFGLHLHYNFSYLVSSTYCPTEWYFKIDYNETQTDYTKIVCLNDAFLLDAWQPDFLRGRRYSIIFTNKTVYQQYIMLYKDAPINNYISAILVNKDKLEVVEETILGEGKWEESIFSTPVIEDYDEWVDVNRKAFDEFPDE